MMSKFTNRVFEALSELVINGTERERQQAFLAALNELERDISLYAMNESQRLANQMANIRLLEDEK